MAISHLLDTSVLTRLHHAAVREIVEPLAKAGRAARASISDLEVGFSARNEAEWDELTESLNVLVEIETTSGHVRRALQVQRQLAARSQRGRKVPDLLVAAAAEKAGCIVLHYDADFDLISAVTGQPSEWVVLAGTVD